MGPILVKISRNGCVSESENVKESYFETFTILCVPMRTFILRQRYFEKYNLLCRYSEVTLGQK